MDKGVSRTIHKWEIGLGIVLAMVLLSGSVTLQSQAALAEQVVRFHVIANSDSEADQALKLLVRDAVLTQASDLLAGTTAQDQAQRILQENLDSLAQTGQAVVSQEGYAYTVTAQLGLEDYPTKDYDGFSLPAGTYHSLRITIGEGAGQNWWCVAFPPLCTTAATDLAVTAMASGLNEPQIALITQEEGYVLQFKAIELWGELKNRLEY